VRIEDFDPRAAIEVLAKHEVRFVVIGGIAAIALGSPLMTSDLDICYARDAENLERLASALKELEAHLRGAPRDVPFLLDAKTLKAGDHFTFETSAGPLDCLGTPAGSKGYEDLHSRAEHHEIAGSTVGVASIDDLIAMKKAAGRPKDLRAVEELSALKEELEGGSPGG
jgi:hypothetical protein